MTRRHRFLFGFLVAVAYVAGPAGLARAQSSYEVLHAFENPGRYPGRSALVEDDDGHLYGATYYGGHAGLDGGGTIFRIDPDGALTTLHHFDCGPYLSCYPDGLLLGSDGFLYGTTAYGGDDGGGTIFRMDTSGTLTTMHSFDCLSGPPCGHVLFLQAADGLLYGEADGLMFRMDTAGHFTPFRTAMLDCDVSPIWCGISSLIQGEDGFFYGTRPARQSYDITGGDVFRMDSGGAATVLHSFRCRDREGCLPLGLAPGRDGFFYGVTQSGGDGSGGTAFRVDAAGNFVTLHSFACGSEPCVPSSPLAPGRDGSFYGTTRGLDFSSTGGIFKMDRKGRVKTLFSSFECRGPDGCQPGALMQASDGRLYGTTGFGAAGDSGTVFTMSMSSRVTTLHAFGRTAEGFNVAGHLVEAGDGRLYGTTLAGGLNGSGTVFGLDRAGVVTTLHSFDCAVGGCDPQAGLVQATDGDLYGTTCRGGSGDAGTAFRIRTTGEYSVVHAFDRDVEGACPLAGLAQGGDGNLYGATEGTSGADCGTVFRLSPTGALTVLHLFSCSEGRVTAPLVRGRDGNLYGTSHQSIFSIDSAGTFRTLSLLPCGGVSPCRSVGLVEGRDGLFYGATSYGGTDAVGTLYRTDLSGSPVVLHSFDCGADGCNPSGPVAAGDGFLYGTTYQGAGDLTGGTLYRMDDAGAFSVLHHFECATDGCQPTAPPVQAGDGALYGATPRFGPGGGGVVFRFAPPRP